MPALALSLLALLVQKDKYCRPLGVQKEPPACLRERLEYLSSVCMCVCVCLCVCVCVCVCLREQLEYLEPQRCAAVA